MLKSLMMALLGLLIGLVGLDPFAAKPRFTFGFKELMDGVGIVPLAMGLFGISEVLLNLEQTVKREVYRTEITGLSAALKEWLVAKWAILRGTSIGFFLGILPGRRGHLALLSPTRWRNASPSIQKNSAPVLSRAWLFRIGQQCSRAVVPDSFALWGYLECGHGDPFGGL
jgi:TctA family transporter